MEIPKEASDDTPVSHELHALAPVLISQVVIDDEFWSPKRAIWQTVTIRDCFRKFEEAEGGAFNNFDKVRDGKTEGHAGPPWTDGLVYEMIHGASQFLQSHPDPELEKQLDGYIDRIVAAAAKDPNGYINTYTELVEPNHRWGLNGGLQVWQHEIYNLGALIDAGVHYYRATGKTALLTAGVRIANYMCDFIGPDPKTNLVPCHELPEEAMLGLYELFRNQPDLASKLPLPVDERKYLSLAEYWIEARGHNTGKPDWTDRGKAEEAIRHYDFSQGRPSWGAYAQDDKPVFEQEAIPGHAVRAVLLCSAVAAAARVNDRKEYRETAVRLWERMVFRRMHISGGVGAYANEESFGPDYALPNNAYLETCAAVGAGFFHHNMNLTFGHARYVDELERCLYNGVLSGVSLKGDSYFYENPLECDEHRERWAWHSCPCCPPMFLKIMGAMPSYIYATGSNSLYVNLFIGSQATLKVEGTDVIVKQTTKYPWEGAVRISVEPSRVAEFDLMVRIPGWCQGASLKVNGQKVPIGTRVRGYARVGRQWKSGDVVELNLPMPVQAMEAHPKVTNNLGRTALMRGPLLYCVESKDNPQILALAHRPNFSTEFWSDKLGGVVAIKASAIMEPSKDWSRTLYTATPKSAPMTQPIFAIPYYANANRGPVRMAVWLPRESQS